MIVSLSDTITIVEGEIESVSFVCEADNDLNATINIAIRWFDDNNHRLSNGDDRITISTTMETGPNRTVMSTLTIDPVIHQDAGQYTCEALNYHGLTDSNITMLIVECKLTISLSVHASAIVMLIVFCSCSNSDHCSNGSNKPIGSECNT